MTTTIYTASKFLSTLSLRRATDSAASRPRNNQISIHALLAESDCYSLRHSAQGRHFYPRSPCGERPIINCNSNFTQKFLSTLSLRRATREGASIKPIFGISIHALLAESDCYSLRHSAQGRHFYPRSPCGERPPCVGWLQIVYYFYPRSPCGERLSKRSPPMCIIRHFYPRSPCGERLDKVPYQRQVNQFLSTLSLRRATRREASESIGTLHFYPRSPCGERRNTNLRRHRSDDNFYPRSPCGERRTLEVTRNANTDFYPRSPCGERPLRSIRSGRGGVISIHALLAESDGLSPSNFLISDSISIHALLAESDANDQKALQAQRISIHALLAESDCIIDIINNVIDHFYPRSPCGERR